MDTAGRMTRSRARAMETVGGTRECLKRPDSWGLFQGVTEPAVCHALPRRVYGIEGANVAL